MTIPAVHAHTTIQTARVSGWPINEPRDDLMGEREREPQVDVEVDDPPGLVPIACAGRA